MAAILSGKFRGFKSRKSAPDAERAWQMDFAGVEFDGTVHEVLLQTGDDQGQPWPAIGEPVAVAVKVEARGGYPQYRLREVLPNPERFQVELTASSAW